MHVDVYITILLCFGSLVKFLLSALLSVFLVLSDSILIIHPVSKLLQNWDVLWNRNICGTYCEGCNQLLPNNIFDEHCYFLERSKHSFLMRRHFQPSRQHFDGLIRLCLAILAGDPDCHTSDLLLLSMSYPSSLFFYFLIKSFFILQNLWKLLFFCFVYLTSTLKTVIIKLLT